MFGFHMWTPQHLPVSSTVLGVSKSTLPNTLKYILASAESPAGGFSLRPSAGRIGSDGASPHAAQGDEACPHDCLRHTWGLSSVHLSSLTGPYADILATHKCTGNVQRGHLPQRGRFRETERRKRSTKMPRLEAHAGTPTFDERLSNAAESPHVTNMISPWTHGREPCVPWVLSSRRGSPVSLATPGAGRPWRQSRGRLLRCKGDVSPFTPRHNRVGFRAAHAGFLKRGLLVTAPAVCARISRHNAIVSQTSWRSSLYLWNQFWGRTDAAFSAALSASSPLPIVDLISRPAFLCLDCLAKGISPRCLTNRFPQASDLFSVCFQHKAECPAFWEVSSCFREFLVISGSSASRFSRWVPWTE